MDQHEPIGARTARWHAWWPRTLAARLLLILAFGMLAAHALSFGLLFYERYEVTSSMLLTNVEHDVVVAVHSLDQLRPQDREAMLPVLRRRTVEFLLAPGVQGHAPLESKLARDMTDRIAGALGPRYPVTANAVSSTPERFQIHLRLSDGMPVTIDVVPSTAPIAMWLPYVLVAQVVLLLLCTWIAVRLATRPLERLARAADNLSPDGRGHAPANGRRHGSRQGGDGVQRHAGSHRAIRARARADPRGDLARPADADHAHAPARRTLEDAPTRDKMLEDVALMQQLVREGIAYARSAHGATEPRQRVDLDAFLDSLVYDYVDTGKAVTLAGRTGLQLDARLNALRRLIANLIDNAVKYAGAAEVQTHVEHGGVRITVLDRGPGIPEDELANVLQPFYRLEASRNRDTGGTGLGLAIAQQLADSLGREAALANREGGGLSATVWLAAHLIPSSLRLSPSFLRKQESTRQAIATGNPRASHADMPPVNGRTRRNPSCLSCCATFAADTSFGQSQYTTTSCNSCDSSSAISASTMAPGIQPVRTRRSSGRTSMSKGRSASASMPDNSVDRDAIHAQIENELLPHPHLAAEEHQQRQHDNGDARAADRRQRIERIVDGIVEDRAHREREPGPQRRAQAVEEDETTDPGALEAGERGADRSEPGNELREQEGRRSPLQEQRPRIGDAGVGRERHATDQPQHRRTEPPARLVPHEIGDKRCERGGQQDGPQRFVALHGLRAGHEDDRPRRQRDAALVR
jgi:signal transduction histidine kinase